MEPDRRLTRPMVLVLTGPVRADRWVFAWQLPAGPVVLCEHPDHPSAAAAARCPDRPFVEAEAPPWQPLGPRPAAEEDP